MEAGADGWKAKRWKAGQKDGLMNGRLGEWKSLADGWLERQTAWRMNGWKDGRLGGCVDRSVESWSGGRMGGWMDGRWGG
jgi:hypothetical protein